MFQSIKNNRGLVLAMIASVVLLGFITGFIVSAAHYMYEFRVVKTSIETSMGKTKHGLGLEICFDDEVREYNENDWKKFSEFVFRLRAGKKQTVFPGDEQKGVLSIRFPDDSRIEFCKTDITEETRLRDDGICIRYTYADGRQYIFDTDQYGFEKIRYWFQKD